MLRTLVLAAMFALALSSPALAGGWAVTTLDSVPDAFDAGQTYSIGYTIRQHGVTPVSVDRTEIRVTHSDSGKRLSFRGVPEGPVGHYVAKVTIPAAGTWTWDVTQGPFEAQPLGTITVSVPGSAALAAPPAAVAAPPAAVAAPPAVTIVQTVPAAPAATGPNALLIAGLLIALAGAAVLFGSSLATATTRARA